MNERQMKLDPKGITKPIQLTAAWFFALILVNSQLITAATLIKEPKWIPPLLMISSIVLVISFIVIVFILQTKFRNQLLSDYFYIKWLQAPRIEGSVTPEVAEKASETGKIEVSPRDRSLMENMILNTLWTKQVNRWPDLNRYFTFSMNFPSEEDRKDFKLAANRLINEKIISQLENGHYLITILGFDYCKKYYKSFPKEQWWPEEQIDKDKLKQVFIES